jgi:phenylacetate-CoA ligase
LIAYESEAMEGMIVDEGVILEILRPGTGDPVDPGEVGEVVVTTLNADYPLIRFATGDLSAVMEEPSPCGRTNLRIKGWMGRADQTTKVRGMFVHPSQVAAVLKRHSEVLKGRLVVDSADNQDLMILRCEVNGEPSETLRKAIADSIRDLCKLRGQVEFDAPGSLANDGKVIDDIRSYE